MSITTVTPREAELMAECERLHVQLAGCGVAALGNTEASKLQRAKPEDYGYSESYAEVCRAVDREIEQRKVLEQALEALTDTVDMVRNEYESAVELYGKYPSRAARIDGLLAGLKAHEEAVTAIQEVLA